MPVSCFMNICLQCSQIWEGSRQHGKKAFTDSGEFTQALTHCSRNKPRGPQYQLEPPVNSLSLILRWKLCHQTEFWVLVPVRLVEDILAFAHFSQPWLGRFVRRARGCLSFSNQLTTGPAKWSTNSVDGTEIKSLKQAIEIPSPCNSSAATSCLDSFLNWLQNSNSCTILHKKQLSRHERHVSHNFAIFITNHLACLHQLNVSLQNMRPKLLCELGLCFVPSTGDTQQREDFACHDLKKLIKMQQMHRQD